MKNDLYLCTLIILKIKHYDYLADLVIDSGFVRGD